jgi:two-component system sensor histidine kinase KdpD
LIKDLLDMSRIESGRLTLNRGDCRLKDIFDSANTRLNSITLNHRLKTILPAGLLPIRVDIIRIGEVITNLVENAVKFSPEGSLITIEAEDKDTELIISVKDNGIGMDADTLENLFSRFYQARRVVSGKTRGTGLGLAICKGIVEAHGGKGSRFSFSIPLVEVG